MSSSNDVISSGNDITDPNELKEARSREVVGKEEIKIPGDFLFDKPVHIPYGYIDKGKTYATVIGIKRKKLIPLRGPYEPKPGDLVVGIIRDIRFGGYSVFINMANDANVFSRNIMYELDYNDIITAKISGVDEVKEVTLDDIKRLHEGIVIKVPPVKVPRILGKNNSMVSLIKRKTGCNMIVGNNGLIWIGTKGNVSLAIESIERVVREAHIPGLTSRMEEFLSKRKPK